tara:strand:+ start:123 stop:19874 length:19752 start_codon:yes stop_codon:yes gene_type:complete
MVYTYENGSWVQKGQDIVGGTGDYLGYSLGISADGNIIVVTSVNTNSATGYFKAYEYIGTSWVQMGQTVVGSFTNEFFGQNLAFSSDGAVVIIGSRNIYGSTSINGVCKVYQYDGSSWVQKGQDLNAEATGDEYYIPSINSDGSIVAVAGINGDINGSNSGYTKVFQYDGSSWVQMGNTILGNAANDQSYSSDSLNADGTIIATASNGSDLGGTNAGLARVYKYNGTTWVQLGNDIYGEAPYDHLNQVSLSSDGLVLVTGSPLNDGAGTDAGHVRVFKYDGTSWIQVGQSIEGLASNNKTPSKGLKLSSDCSTLILGNHRYNTETGIVRVFSIPKIQTINTTTVFALGDNDHNKLEMTTSDVTTLTLTNGGVAYDVSYNGMLSDFTHIVGAINNNSMKLYVNNTLVDSTLVDTATVRQINKTLIATNPVEDTANPYDGEWPSGLKLLDTNINYTLDDITINDDAIKSYHSPIHSHHIRSPLNTMPIHVFKTPVPGRYVYVFHTVNPNNEWTLYLEFELSITNNNLYIESTRTTYVRTPYATPTDTNYSGTAYTTLDQRPYFTELHINVKENASLLRSDNKTFTYNYLGSNLSNTSLFEGSMVYFKTWTDYALSTSEITNLYENREPPSVDEVFAQEDFTTMTTKAEPEVVVDSNSNTVTFNNKFFEKFTRPNNLSGRRTQSKTVLRQILTQFSANIGTNKLIVGKEDVDLPHIFVKPKIRVVVPTQLTNNTLNIENDLASDEGFYVDLVDENDEIILENTDGSSVKIVKLSGETYRVTETDENGTEVEFTESANYSGQVGKLVYSLGSVSGEISTETAATQINRHWEFRNSTLNNYDVVNNVDALLVDFLDTDSNANGIDFNGTSKYIDLGSNTITVGNDDGIGSGFSFETYVKNDPVYEEAPTLDLTSNYSLLGDYIKDESGGHGDDPNSCSISRDGTTIAIGAFRNDGGANDAGQVRVYRYDSNKTTEVTDQTSNNFGPIGWTRLGGDIDFYQVSGYAGTLNSVAINSNGTIVAIGAPYHINSDIGLVRVFQYDITKTTLVTDETSNDFGPIGWRRIGSDIIGNGYWSYTGQNMTISDDGTTIAFQYSDNPSNVHSRTTRIYKYDGSSWNLLGDPLFAGFYANRQLTPDGSKIVANLKTNGWVFVFEYDANRDYSDTDVYGSDYGPIGWRAIGGYINTGWSTQDIALSINSDGTIVATGYFWSGEVKVFKYNGTSWSQMGVTLTGSYLGNSISLSLDGKIMAVSSNRSGGGENGYVRIYYYNESWNQIGSDINGSSPPYRVGEQISLSGYGERFVTAHRDGLTRVYEIPHNRNLLTKHIIALGHDSSNKLELTTSDVTTLTLTNGGVAYDVSYNDVLSDFTHIVGTISNHTMKLYVNNTLVDSTSVTPYGDNKTFAYNYLGSDLPNTTLFKGSIAYFKTWKDYTLTTNEVAELYNSRSIIASVTREETSSSELNHYWEFRNSTLNNIDSINNVEASLVNFLESDSDENGINFDGTSKYIDLSSNVIVVGNDASKGNGFAFETYVKSLNPNIPTTTVFALGDDNHNKLEMTTSNVTTLTLTNGGVAYDVSYNGMLSEFTHIVGTVNNKTMKLYVNNTLVDSTAVKEIDKTLIATNPVENTANPYDGEWPSGPKLLDTNINYTLDDITINADDVKSYHSAIHGHHITRTINDNTTIVGILKTSVPGKYVWTIYPLVYNGNNYIYFEFDLSISNNNLYIEHIQSSWTPNAITDSNYDNAIKYTTLDQQPYITELHINVQVIKTLPLYADNKTFAHNYLGSDLSNTSLFEGSMAYFRVWKDYALSTSEITNLYNDRNIISIDENATRTLDKSFNFRDTYLGYKPIENAGITFNNFVNADTKVRGIDFDGVNKYIDMGSNTINVGGNDTDNDGFAFETYIKNIPVYETLFGEWNKMGQDIDGEAAGDEFGKVVSMNSDGTIVAVGAVKNDGVGVNSGHVRIYNFVGSQWTQLGQDIDGVAEDDQNGWSVSLNADGTIVAIGAIHNDSIATNVGQVRVFQYTQGEWVQMGEGINGEGPEEKSGYSVSLSSNGLRLAIGSPFNDLFGFNAGQVRVYEYSNNDWNPLGQKIFGQAVGDNAGYAVSLSSDGSKVAVGAYLHDSTGINSGQVRVFEYNGSQWSQMGQDIDGEAAGDYSGMSVAMNSDGTIVAIGGENNDGNGSNSGHVRVYQYSGLQWSQMGQDIDGEAAEDRSGYSVSISSDGSIVAIGAIWNDGKGSRAGQVRVYKYSGSQWNMIGSDIDGEAANDQSGYSVSLSSDGRTVAIGAILNDGNGSNSGQVRVYNIPQVYPVSTIMSLSDSATNKLELTTYDSDSLILQLTNNGVSYDVSYNGSLVDYTHVFGKIVNNVMSLYVNNVLIDSVGVTQFELGKTFTNNYLGCNYLNTSFFHGSIAYFKTWLDYELIYAERTSLYENRDIHTFIFTLDSSVWNAQNPNYAYPVKNNNNSFKNLLTSYDISNSNAVVFIEWNSYTSNQDTIVFDNNLNYFDESSITVLTPFSEMSAFFTPSQLIHMKYPISDVKSVATPADLIGVYTQTDIIGAGYSAAELYDASFNISSLTSTYSPSDLSGSYEQTDIIESGYSATELYDSSFNVSALITTFTPQDLSGIYSQTEIVSSGYTVLELFDGSFEASSLVGTFTPQDLSGIYTTEQIIQAGFPASQLKDFYPPTDLSSVYSDQDIIEAGYEVTTLSSIYTPTDLSGAYEQTEIAAAGYSASDLYDASFNADVLTTTFTPTDLSGLYTDDEIISAGFQASDLKDIYTVSDLSAAYTQTEIAEAGYSFSELVDASFNADALVSTFTPADLSGTYTDEDIIQAGFEASQLKETYTPADLSSNYTEEEIASAGYSVAELADASFNAATLVNNYAPTDLSGSYTDEEIIQAGFQASQLKETYTPADLSSNYTEEEIVSAGYSVAELVDASFNATALVTSYTPEDLSGSYTDDEIIHAGFQASQLKTSYTPTDLSGTYTEEEIVTAGYSVSELADASFNATSLVTSYTPEDLSGVYTTEEIVNAGYSSAQLKDTFSPTDLSGSYTEEEIVTAGYSVSELVDASFNAASLVTTFTPQDLSGSYTKEEIVEAGFTVEQLKSDYTPSDLCGNYTQEEILDAGYSVTELADASFNATSLVTKFTPQDLSSSYTTEDIVSAGYSIDDLKDIYEPTDLCGNYTEYEILNAGFSATQLADAGFNASSLTTKFTPQDLSGIYTDEDIIGAGFEATVLKEIYTPQDLSSSYTTEEIVQAGYTVTELADASFNATDLVNNFTPQDLSGLYADEEIITAGFQASDLKDTYSPQDLSGTYTDDEIIHAGYQASDLKETYSPQDLSGTYTEEEIADAGYSLSELTTDISLNAASLVNTFTPEDLSGAFTNEEIVEAGFQASQLKDTFTPADLSSNYTEEEIVSAGYSVTELADASFNAAALVNNFIPEDLSGTYTDEEIIEAGFEATQLVTKFTPADLSANYTEEEIVSAGYGVQALADASFNATALVNTFTPEDLSGTYTDDEIIHAGFQASQLKTSYTPTDLSGTYTEEEIVSAGYSVTELADASFNATSLVSVYTPEDLSGTYTKEEIVSAGYSITDLVSSYKPVDLCGNYTEQEIVDSGYSIEDLAEASISASSLINNYSPSDLSGVYDDTQIIEAGFEITQLKDKYTPSDLSGAYTEEDIIQAGYSVTELADASFNASSLINNYNPTDLSGVYEQTEIISAGFTVAQMHYSGYSASELIGNYSPSDLSGIYTQTEILNAGYSVLELYNTGFASSSLVGIYDVTDLSGVYSDNQILTAGYNVQELLDINFTDVQIRTVGYTSLQFKNDANYDATELIGAGFGIQDLYDASFGIIDISNAGFNGSQLREVGFNISEMSVAGFSNENLFSAGYTASEMLVIEQNVVNLKTLGYSALQLKEAGIILTELYNANFTITELQAAGYTTSELTGVGYGLSDFASIERILGLSGWIVRKSSSKEVFDEVFFSNGLFIATSKNSYKKVIYSSVDGIVWEKIFNSNFVNFQSMAYGNSIWIAIKDHSVLTSIDGTNWVFSDTNLEYAWYSIAYGNNLFVAIAGYPTQKYLVVSTNGVEWSIITTPVNKNWVSLTYGNDNFVVVADDNTEQDILTSVDGATWTPQTSPSGDNKWRKIEYGNGMFVVVGNRVMTSENVSEWQLEDSINKTWNSLTYGNGRYVACAMSDGSSYLLSSDMVQYGYSSVDLKNAGFTNQDLLDNGYELVDFVQSQTPLNELKDLSYNASELLEYFSGSEIRQVGYTLNDFTTTVTPTPSVSTFKLYGFTLQNFLDESYSVGDLLNDFSVYELRVDGSISADTLYANNVTSTQMKTAGFTLSELISSGYSLSQLVDAEYTLQELKDANYSALDLKGVGFDINELYQVEFTLVDLSNAEYGISDLYGVGFSLTQLKDAGYTSTEVFTSLDISYSQLFEVGYSVTEIQDAGAGLQDLAGIGYSATVMKSLNFTSTELVGAGYGLQQLYEANYGVTDLSNSGFTLSELKGIGFSVGDLHTSGYSTTQLYDVGFNAIELKSVGETIDNLKGFGFSALELRNADFDVFELKDAGFLITDLQAAGYEVSDLSSVGFSLADILAITISYSLSPWQLRSTYTNTSLYSVVYSNGLFVAISYGSNTNVQTSVDGIQWKEVECPDYMKWTSVAYGNDMYVALADSYDKRLVVTSEDGVNWSIANTFDDYYFYSMAYGNGLFVAIADKRGSGRSIITSTDGLVWTESTIPVQNDWRSITYGKNKFVVVSTSGNNDRVMTSSDGIDWTVQVTPEDNGWCSVAYGNNMYVAVANSGTSNRVMSSSDGITWTLDSYTTTDNFSSIAYGNGRFVALSYSSGNNYILTTDVLKFGFTSEDLKIAQVSVQDLSANFTVIELKDSGYTAEDLNTGGYTIQDLYDASFNASEVQGAGYDVQELNDVGFTTSELKSAGFTVVDLSGVGKTLEELKEAEFTAEELTDANFTIQELKDVSFSAVEVQQAGATLSDLKTVGYKATELTDVGYSLKELVPRKVQTTSINYNIPSIDITDLDNDGGATVTAIKTNIKNRYAIQFSVKPEHIIVLLLPANSVDVNIEVTTYDDEEATTNLSTYTNDTNAANDLLTDIVSGAESQNNTAASQKAQAVDVATVAAPTTTTVESTPPPVYTLSELKEAGFTALELKNQQYTLQELIDVGFIVVELRIAQYTAVELKATGFTIQELIDGGFEIEALKDADFELGDLITYYTGPELKQMGYTLTDFTLSASYTVVELKAFGFLPSEFNADGYTVLELSGSFTISQLRISGGYTATQMFDSNVTATDAKNGGYTLNNLKSSPYSINDIKTAGFTAGEMREAGYVLSELISVGYTAAELKSASYTAVEFKAEGFTAAQLRAVDYNVQQLDNANYTSTELKEGGYSAGELRSVEYTALQLRNIGYTDQELFDGNFTLPEFKESNFSVADLLALFTGSNIRTTGYTLNEFNSTTSLSVSTLKSYGFSIGEFKSESYTPAQLVNDYTVNEMRVAQYTATEMKASNISATDMKNGNYTLEQLVNGSYTISELKQAEYTVSGLKQHFTIQNVIDVGFTKTEIYEGGYTVSEMRGAGYTAGDMLPVVSNSITTLKSAGYTLTEFKNTTSLSVYQLKQTHSAAEFKAAGYTINELTAVNDFSISQLRLAGGYTSTEMKNAGITATDAKAGGYSLFLLKSGGYTASELYQANYTALEMKNDGFTDPGELISAGYTLQNIHDAEYDSGLLRAIQYTASQLKAVGYTSTELKNGGYEAQELKDADYTAQDMKTAGYNPSTMRGVGYNASQLKAINYSAGELKTAGYSASELKVAAFGSTQMRAAGFTANELKDATYTLTEMKTGGYTVSNLKPLYTIQELKDVNFTVSEMKPNYTIQNIIDVGYSINEIYNGGYNVSEMRDAEYTAGEMLPLVSNSVATLKDGGYTLTEFKNETSLTVGQLKGQFNAGQFKNSGYTITQLREFNDFTVTQLRITGGFTADQMRNESVTIQDVKAGGYSLYSLINAGYTTTEFHDADYTVEQLVNESLSATDIRTGGYTAPEMISHFTSLQMRGAGFAAVQLKNAGSSLTQLKQGGYSLQQLKDNGFTINQFKNSGISAGDMKTAGFSGKSLKNLGYTATTLRQLGYSLFELAKTTIAKKYKIVYNVKGLDLADLTIDDGVILVNIKTRIRDRYATKFNLPIDRLSVNVFDANSVDVEVEATTTSSEEEAAVESNSGNDTEDIITEESGQPTDPNTTTTNTTITNEEFIGYTATELKEAGYDIEELYDAGFTKPELFEAGFGISDFRRINTSKAELLELGFTEEQIKEAGIEFYLEVFNTTIQMSTLAEMIEGQEINPISGFDATAILYLPQSIVNDVFTVKLTGDLYDLDNVNITYFTNMDAWPSGYVINSVNAMMDHEQSTGAIYELETREKMLLKHDFIRYIAYKTFGSVHAVDLFSNEDELIAALNEFGNNNFQQDISGILWKYASTNPNPVVNANYVYDADYQLYGTTDAFISSENVCRELFQQLLKSQKSRFSNMVANPNGLYPIPIIDGDTISFTCTITPSPEQRVLSTNESIGSKIYKIIIIVGDQLNNTDPVD